MKRNKIQILCAAAILVVAPLAGAQTRDDAAGPPCHHHGRPNIAARLTRTLNLTDEQKTQVQALADAVQPQLDAIHQQARVAAGAVLKRLDTQVRPLLTADQQKRLDALETLRETAPHDAPPPE